MNITEILEKIDLFNIHENMEDYDITIFFDEITDSIPQPENLSAQDKEKAVSTLFNFLSRQSPEMYECWSFVHLIESFDGPKYKMYFRKLVHHVQKTPCFTSILLLNRFINSLEGKTWEDTVNILKIISEKEGLSELVKQEALETYKHQLES